MKPMTPVRRAELQRDEAVYQEARRLATSAAGEQGVRQTIAELMGELASQCEEVNASKHMQIRHGEFKQPIWEYVITDGRVSICVSWQWERTPTELGYLAVAEFDQELRVPGDPHIRVHLGEPKRLRTSRYKPDLSRARELGWHDEETEGFVSSKKLAETCVIDFIELTGKPRPVQSNMPARPRADEGRPPYRGEGTPNAGQRR